MVNTDNYNKSDSLLYFHLRLPSHFLPSSALTLTDGASSTGLRQTVALPHGAAQADVHEALCGSREWSTARKQHPRVPSQERAHPFEHQTAWVGREEDKNTQHGDDY